MQPFDSMNPMNPTAPATPPTADPVALASFIHDAPAPDQMANPEQEAPQRSNNDIADDEIRSMILTRQQASREFFQDRKLTQDKCWNNYKQIADKTGKESWQSTRFVGESPKVAEVITSNMHSALMGPEKPVEYQATRPEFEDPVRDANDLIASDFEKSKFKVHWTDSLRSLCIIGTSVGKIEYRKEYADVPIKERVKPLVPGFDSIRQMLGFPPAPSEQTTIQRKVVKDHASYKDVDRYDIFPQPYTTEISKDNWIIERGRICNYKLIELTKDEENPVTNLTDDVLANAPKQLDDDGDKQERDAALGQTNKSSAYLDPDQEHELLEYWGPAPLWMVQPELYGDESKKYEMVHAWFWLIDGQHVVRKQRTPWRDAEPPYVKGVYIRVPGQWDGIGPLELMLDLQAEINEQVNTRQDNVNLILNKMVAVVKSAVAQGEWSRLVSGPGGLWVFDNIDDIKKAFTTIDFPDITADSWRSTAEVRNEIQEITAAVKATVGSGGGDDQAGGSTFRGQLLNKQAASDRFIMYARMLEITSLGDAIRKFYQRIYQFKGWKEAGQILGPQRAQKFQFVSPEDLETMAKLVPMGVTTMENKGVKLAQMSDEFKMFSAFPWFKAVEHARRMVEIGGDSPDISIMTDDELKQYNDAKRRMIAQNGMPPDGGPGGLPPPDANQPPPSPIAGNTPGPTDGLPPQAQPARGPGASPIDGFGRPV